MPFQVDEEKNLPQEIVTDPDHYKKDEFGRNIEDEAALKQKVSQQLFDAHIRSKAHFFSPDFVIP